MQNCNEIISFLFVGDRHALDNYYNYELIVNCTPNLPFPEYNTKRIRIPIKDDHIYDRDLFELLENNNILENINEYVSGGQGVLINCNCGVQRSCAVAACYLVKYHRYTPERAIKKIQNKRPQAFSESVHFYDTINNIYNKKCKVFNYVKNTKYFDDIKSNLF